MAELSVNSLDEDGFADISSQLTSAASGGDKYISDERTFLFIENGGSASVTVTVSAQDTEAIVPSGGTVTVSDLTLTVTAGNSGIIAAPKRFYNDGDGKVNISYDQVSSVSVGAFKMNTTLV